MPNLYKAEVIGSLAQLASIEKFVQVRGTMLIDPDMPEVRRDEHVKRTYSRKSDELTGRQVALNAVEAKGPCSTADVKDAFDLHGKPRPSADGALSYLKQSGKIIQGKDGLWKLS